jgi:hypothetical protein
MSRFNDIIQKTLKSVNETASILGTVYKNPNQQKNVSLVTGALGKLSQGQGTASLSNDEIKALNDFGTAFQTAAGSTSTQTTSPSSANTTTSTTATVGPGSNPSSQQVSATAGY